MLFLCCLVGGVLTFGLANTIVHKMLYDDITSREVKITGKLIILTFANNLRWQSIPALQIERCVIRGTPKYEFFLPPKFAVGTHQPL